MVLESMQIISRMTGNCVKFVERTNETDYLLISTLGFRCQAHVGRSGGRQILSTQRACLHEHGSVQHELMHTLGFYHEHQRPDRDDNVEIIWSNISPEWNDSFAIIKGMETYRLPYDYDSVTHFSAYEYAINRRTPTIIPKVEGKQIGQNNNLSPLDVVRIHMRYKCGVAAASYFTDEPRSKKSTTAPFLTKAFLQKPRLTRNGTIYPLQTANGTAWSGLNSTIGDDNDNATTLFTETISSRIVLPAALGTLVPIAAVAIIVALCWLRLKKQHQGQSTMRKARWHPHSLVKSMVLHDLSSVHADLLLNDPALHGHVKILEISLAKVMISNTLLGRGATGIVWKGTVDGVYGHPGQLDVAIKSARRKHDTGCIRQLVQEMKIMTQAGRHLNIVNLLGVVTKGEVILLLEYAQFGSLSKYLQSYNAEHFYNHIDENGGLLPYDEDEAELFERLLYTDDSRSEDGLSPPCLSSKALMSFVYQISRGMEYLGTKSIIHRDLAARNVLICDRNVVKIGDFGMAQVGTEDIPFGPKEALPVRWMPPEAIANRIFSNKSDVWSFGVVMWEAFSLGKLPYGDSDIMRQSISEFITSLKNGLRLEKPKFCPSAIYNLMLQCWKFSPDDRTDFAKLTLALRLVIDNDSAETYLLLDNAYNQFNSNYLTILENVMMDGSVSLDRQLL
ncbi:platelet-derived growth factor receptor beta-like [Paramacrobiotus metropolitanus]|uniref:platelet-derived growth factor receptor beta-like n=1 Tax=Paramacrobiotus metropolitanus TaxID=2943436 RepID=UPI002445654B|nr:platelet-derived growth factor receptor beta-like [Paramacrobiotus metropolitanus]